MRSKGNLDKNSISLTYYKRVSVCNIANKESQLLP
jgi:hypothetical protein